jgi:hypothetical protein
LISTVPLVASLGLIISAETESDKAEAEERAKVNAVLAQLEAEKSAAEAEVRAMELIAYGGVISLMILVMVVFHSHSEDANGAASSSPELTQKASSLSDPMNSPRWVVRAQSRRWLFRLGYLNMRFAP